MDLQHAAQGTRGEALGRLLAQHIRNPESGGGGRGLYVDRGHGEARRDRDTEGVGAEAPLGAGLDVIARDDVV